MALSYNHQLRHFRPAAPFVGEYAPLGDKSLSHRALLFAALAEGESEIRNFPASGVIFAMMRCLRALGVECSLDEATHVLHVKGVGLRGFKDPEGPLDCGNSATTLRLLAGVLAGAGVTCTLTGSAGLCKRPMGRIVEPLRMMGAEITATNGCAPLTIRPAKLTGISYTLPVASAQVKSCLLLAGLYADAPTALLEPGPSRDHTERMLAAMGVQVRNVERPAYGAVMLPFAGALQPLNLDLPGDISSAAFLLVRAYLLPGSDFRIRRVCINPTRTAILEALQRFGADLTFEHEGLLAGEPVADLHIRHRPIAPCAEPITFAGECIVRMIDELPALLIAAALTPAITSIRDAAELRTQESDRLRLMVDGLRAFGLEVVEAPDGCRLQGRSAPLLPPADPIAIHTAGDHRVAMCFALLATQTEAAVEIDDFDCVRESFPDFFALCGL